MVKELYERMSDAVKIHLDNLKKQYSLKQISCSTSREYVNGLRDAGVITERESQILFIYTTV